MKRRYLAVLLAMTMLCGALTACGDSDDDDSSSGKKSSTRASSAKDDEDETDEDETTEASTLKIEKATGSKRETGTVASEPETTEAATTEPVTEAPVTTTSKPKQPVKLNINPVDLAGMRPGEIAQMLGGEFDLASDDIVGYYQMYNNDVLPGVTFHFEDHTWDNMWYNADINPTYYDTLCDNITASRQTVNKINCDSGRIDEFTPGMTYADCSKIIGEFPTSGSDNGYTFCGCPMSVAYYYLHENRNCIVKLHFELEGELNRALNEGYFYRNNCGDISHTEMLRYNPKLQRIEIDYAPDRTSSAPRPTCTSKLPDITNNGKKYTYGPENLIDGDFSTCWCEGASDTGIGQSVTFPSSTMYNVGYITVFGGLLSSQDSFYKNCRPSRMNIGSDGMIIEYLLPTNYSTKYRRAIPVAGDGADSYTLTITDVESGTSYSDTCISEVRFNGYMNTLY